MINRTPLYNLNVVLRETGLKADVIRAWERRYQLPLPQRSAGGQRLYSEYDIETIKWLKNRQAEGLSISRAVQMWRDLSQTADPLAQNHPEEPETPIYSMQVGDLVHGYRDSWVLACLAFDARSSDDTVNRALSMFPVETVCTQVLQSGLSHIGDLWHLGKASPQQEHFASNLAHNRMQALIAACPTPKINKTIIVGCPPGELHTFPLLILDLFLRREGYAVINLGADIPIVQLAETIERIKPNMVILSAQRLVSAAALEKMVSSISDQGTLIGYGGVVFSRMPKLRSAIAGHYLGDSLEDAIESIKILLSNPANTSNAIPVLPETRELSAAFTAKRPLIEHSVSALLADRQIAIPNFPEVTAFFGDSVAAALWLGDITTLEPDMLWVKELIASRNGSSEVLIPYLQAYSGALQQEMGDTALPVCNWIDHIIAQINN